MPAPLLLALIDSLFLALAPLSVEAASYRRLDGVLDGPILFEGSGLIHPFAGIDLEPDAILTGASLRDAFLADANLQRTDLRGANL